MGLLSAFNLVDENCAYPFDAFLGDDFVDDHFELAGVNKNK